MLTHVGFKFDDGTAEWHCWFGELRRFHQREAHSDLESFSSEQDMYLINWCSVQRIAARCKQLSDDRIALLDSIDFDWTGADALS